MTMLCLCVLLLGITASAFRVKDLWTNPYPRVHLGDSFKLYCETDLAWDVCTFRKGSNRSYVFGQEQEGVYQTGVCLWDRGLYNGECYDEDSSMWMFLTR